MSHIINPKIEEILGMLRQADVYSVSSDANLYEAMTLMRDRDITAVPVIDDGRIVGVVSEQAFVRKAYVEGLDSLKTKVSEIMTSGKDIISVSLSETAKSVLELMNEKNIRHVPVVDGGICVGFLSQRGILRALDILEDDLLEAQKAILRGNIM